MAPLTDPKAVLDKLLAGDRLVHCQGEDWRLLRAGRLVVTAAIAALKSMPGGRLRPQHDSLPGLGAPQSWRGARQRQPKTIQE